MTHNNKVWEEFTLGLGLFLVGKLIMAGKPSQWAAGGCSWKPRDHIFNLQQEAENKLEVEQGYKTQEARPHRVKDVLLAPRLCILKVLPTLKQCLKLGTKCSVM